MAALAVLWHCAQLALLLGALAWILVIVGKAEKSPWQDEHCALAANGMCTAGAEGPLKLLKLLWQLEHSPCGWLASATKKVPEVACGRVWKPVYGATLVIGYCSTPIHTMPVSWQLLQLPVTPA